MDVSILTKNQRTINALKNKKLDSVEKLLRNFPKKQYDFRTPKGLNVDAVGKYVAVVGELIEVCRDNKNGRYLVKARLLDKMTGRKLYLTWFGAYYFYDVIKDWINEEVIAGGLLTYGADYQCFFMTNPIVFSNRIKKEQKIHTIYGNIKGISDEKLRDLIKEAMQVSDEKEYLTDELRKKYDVMSISDALLSAHYPQSEQDLESAQKRIDVDNLVYFASKLEINSRKSPKGSAYSFVSAKKTYDFIKSLPFELTKDQRKTFEEIKENIRDGRRINALVQGDVGCGKTIIAFLSMFLMADGGYQSALMTPTEILATQHYKELKEYGDRYGYRTALLVSKMKASEKRKTIEGIKNGEYTFVVGTHSILSETVTFQNLGMVITDEEHKFGVLQRKSLEEKAREGVHSITMSATPIPRTIAETVYGENLSVYTIQSKPEGRIPVQTAITNNMKLILDFAKKQVDEKHQIYVVCPRIEDVDSDADKKQLLSVTKTEEIYRDYFKGTDVQIGVVTGKTKKEEKDRILEGFYQNRIQILISTTVIEVGVNTPNATLIVINDAQQFGLAGLHQLRGRVGRSNLKSYCILKADVSDATSIHAKRLQIMTKKTDGFELAKADMMQRGTGSLIGQSQAGTDKYITLVLQYENLWKEIKEDAKEFADSGLAEIIIKLHEQIYSDEEQI